MLCSLHGRQTCGGDHATDVVVSTSTASQSATKSAYSTGGGQLSTADDNDSANADGSAEVFASSTDAGRALGFEEMLQEKTIRDHPHMLILEDGTFVTKSLALAHALGLQSDNPLFTGRFRHATGESRFPCASNSFAPSDFQSLVPIQDPILSVTDPIATLLISEGAMFLAIN